MNSRQQGFDSLGNLLEFPTTTGKHSNVWSVRYRGQLIYSRQHSVDIQFPGHRIEYDRQSRVRIRACFETVESIANKSLPESGVERRCLESFRRLNDPVTLVRLDDGIDRPGNYLTD